MGEAALTKVCTKCGGELPATTEYFYRHPTGKGGLFGACIPCQKIINREYYLATREQRLEYGNTYYAENREQQKANSQAYRRANPEKVRLCRKKRNDSTRTKELRRQYYLNNREKVNEAQRRHRANNPEKVRLKDQKRRSRHGQVPYSFSDRDWQACLAYWHHTCVYCGAQQSFWHPLEMEHVIPLSSPHCPGTVPTNIIPACKSCNPSKGDLEAAQWLNRKFGKRRAKQILERIETYFVSVREVSNA